MKRLDHRTELERKQRRALPPDSGATSFTSLVVGRAVCLTSSRKVFNSALSSRQQVRGRQLVAGGGSGNIACRKHVVFSCRSKSIIGNMWSATDRHRGGRKPQWLVFNKGEGRVTELDSKQEVTDRWQTWVVCLFVYIHISMSVAFQEWSEIVCVIIQVDTQGQLI